MFNLKEGGRKLRYSKGQELSYSYIYIYIQRRKRGIQEEEEGKEWG
jgi:hypothetical protein